MSTNWYYVEGTERVGPVTEEVLKSLFDSLLIASLTSSLMNSFGLVLYASKEDLKKSISKTR